MSASRVQIAKGTIANNQSHSSETIIVVLEGAWRFHLAERVITLQKDEVLRIPAHERYSAEALKDTVAVKVASEGNHAAVPHDPDQYLWGV